MLIKSEVRVAVFEAKHQNTDFDPAAIENRRLVWTLSSAAGSKVEGSISYHVILKD